MGYETGYETHDDYRAEVQQRIEAAASRETRALAVETGVAIAGVMRRIEGIGEDIAGIMRRLDDLEAVSPLELRVVSLETDYAIADIIRRLETLEQGPGGL
jgi:hypothetical protein